MRVLIINSYAGSLTIGASTLGCEIIGSYEDKKFFLDAQRANFPNLEYREYIKDWPAQDLSEVVVIAHPPCSAFSVQNTQPGARGPNSAAFKCTRDVLDYAMKNRAAVIAIESVMGALGGAWDAHQYYADTHGYHIYRVLENGCMWGCQWRERFWAVWVRRGVAPDVMPFTLTPRYHTVSEVITGHEDGPAPGNLERLLEVQKQRLIDEAKCTPEEMAFFFEPQEPPHPTIALGNLLWEKKFKQPDSFPEERWEVFQDYIGGFASGTMVHLGPDDIAPVLMGGSFWYYNGRCVSETGFKRIAGFPADYIFPESPRNLRKDMRTGLSKGVMPPIAAWILEQVGRHTNMRALTEPSVPSYHLECQPNHIVDFRIRKKDWRTRHEELPPLRHHDDERLKRRARE